MATNTESHFFQGQKFLTARRACQRVVAAVSYHKRCHTILEVSPVCPQYKCPLVVNNYWCSLRGRRPLTSESLVHDPGWSRLASSCWQVCEPNAALISISASSSIGWCDWNRILQDSQMPSAIGVSFMILKLRFTIRTVSNSFETNASSLQVAFYFLHQCLQLGLIG